MRKTKKKKWWNFRRITGTKYFDLDGDEMDDDLWVYDYVPRRHGWIKKARAEEYYSRDGLNSYKAKTWAKSILNRTKRRIDDSITKKLAVDDENLTYPTGRPYMTVDWYLW